MATSSSSDDELITHQKSPGKAQSTEKQNRKSRAEASDKICGFHPLRSLRNIFFGYKRRSRTLLADGEEPDQVPRAKSTEDIISHPSRKDEDGPVVVFHKPHTTPTTTTTDSTIIAPPRRKSRSRSQQSVNKQLSLSADNLVAPDDWIPAPHGILSLVNTPVIDSSENDGSADSLLSANHSEIDGGLGATDSVDEFFDDKWTLLKNKSERSSKERSYSSGDADESKYEYDLNAVRSTKALDVSHAKDRISIMPKGKRVTVAMQQKIQMAEVVVLPKSPIRTPLYSLTEYEEDEEDDKAKMLSVSAPDRDLQNNITVEQDMPVKPLRREKAPQIANSSSSSQNRATIGFGMGITPEMLAGAMKKSSGRGSQKSKHLDDDDDQGARKRMTTVVPEKTGDASELRQDTGKMDNSVPTSEVTRPKKERPAAPPRPKTRPKTMMPKANASDASF